jgi:menaquinone reductase, multiheme cytochrome c subunit
MRAYQFPRWTNTVRPVFTALLAGGLVYVVVLAIYGMSGKTTNVGYEPQQPVPFSHKLHAGDMGIDCRYCHTGVEKSAVAGVPPTQTCMNCHSQVRVKSEKLQPVRDSYATGMPIPWVKVHDLPDYAYFNHSAHVTRGVGCASCHGRVDKMETVYQAKPLTMSWCLDCHRRPEENVRPVDQVTKMDWQPAENQVTQGRRLCQENNLHPSTDCSTCHR